MFTHASTDMRVYEDSLHFILCIIICLAVSQITLFSSSFGQCFAFFCMALIQAGNLLKATQTNMEESECDTERDNCKQEDSDQPGQNEGLVHKRGATFCHVDELWT